MTVVGDTSPSSGLSLERFVSADADGNLGYHRSVVVPKEVAKNLANLHMRRLVRIWQRHDRVIAIEDVIGLETAHGDLRLDPAAAPPHPHDLSEDSEAGDARHPPL